MTNRKEIKMIRKAFRDAGENYTNYYNDRYTNSRRRIFKAGTQSRQACQIVLNKIERQGIYGWRPWSGRVIMYPNGPELHGIMKREPLND
jgi:hypothetical protein